MGIEYYDIDVWGATDESGVPVRHGALTFMRNLVEAWLTAEDDDYIRGSGGGDLDYLNFKLMTEDNKSYYAARLQSTLEIAFPFGIVVKSVTLDYNKTGKKWDVKIDFIDNITNNTDVAEFSYRVIENNIEAHERVYIYEQGDNLRNLMMLIFFEVAGLPLSQAESDGVWQIGRYTFPLLQKDSQDFLNIQNMIRSH